MKVFRFGTAEFEQALQRVVNRISADELNPAEDVVREIIAGVRQRGDAALIEYTQKLDGVRISPADLELSQDRMGQALADLEPETRHALQVAHDRIRVFHQRQLPRSWEMRDQEGNRLGHKIIPIDRVGVYIPGGKAAYPSTVLMNVVPARTAGVGEIIAVTPPGRVRENRAILAAARISGVDRIFQVGGAQAIAALAYGTETIPRVDKIVGPGNLFVTMAKRQVFGTVDIDMIAGPSEILIIADGSTDAGHLAADLLAQAEHDEHAVPILVATSEAFLRSVLASLERQLAEGPWEQVARQSILHHGKAFLVRTIDEAVELANRIAPEHLEVALKKTEGVLEKIRHAGSIFLGPYSAETLGDYVAGPNHVLPTSGTARFFSPLGTYDFVKRSNYLEISESGLLQLGPLAVHLARTEGLLAHARTLELRLQDARCSSPASPEQEINQQGGEKP